VDSELKSIVVWKLLEIAESVNAPDEIPSDDPDWCADKSFDAKNGWKVVIFYDCGELDYIAHFINPKGEIIDFWDWGGDCFDHDAPDFNRGKNILINWRGNGDMERLKKIVESEGK